MALETIPQNTAVAALRRVKFALWDSTNPLLCKDITVTGIKPKLVFSDSTTATATNDIVKTGSGTTVSYHHELTQSESNNAIGGAELTIDATSLGAAMEKVFFSIGPSDALDTAPTTVTLATDGIPAAAISTGAAAAIKGYVVAALSTDTYAEPSAPPAATASLAAKVGWLFSLARNKLTQTATTQALRNDADSANIGTAAVSDNGTTFTRDEWA